MSYWAELDENNIVLRVLVGDDNDPNRDRGYQWLLDNLGGRWIETSYDGEFRFRYAGIGYSYDEELDAFIRPKPFESWILDKEKADWTAAVPYPEDGNIYVWNEETVSWKEVIIQQNETNTNL